MKVAIPTDNGLLCAHFGHAPQFTFVELDPESKAIGASETDTPPPHEPGHIPKWIVDHGATHVLAGNMGHRAKEILAAKGIEVLCGIPELPADQIVRAFVEGTLETSDVTCEGGRGHGPGHGQGHGQGMGGGRGQGRCGGHGPGQGNS
ncbi:ATPase [candidate division GN15 bacterium]|nr:ATPase [candidate division GN15 bacterium]